MSSSRPSWPPSAAENSPLKDNLPRLSAQLVANQSADPENAISGGLIAEVVRAVLDEYRLDARHPRPASLLLEARHRLERFERAGSDNRHP